LTDDNTAGASEPGLPQILVLGRDTCEDTIRSRGYLHLQGIPYVYRNVELDPAADEWNRSFNGGDRVTPVILVGDPNDPSAILIEPSDEDLGVAIKGAARPI
jgi:glutaredoxin